MTGEDTNHYTKRDSYFFPPPAIDVLAFTIGDEGQNGILRIEPGSSADSFELCLTAAVNYILIVLFLCGAGPRRSNPPHLVARRPRLVIRFVRLEVVHCKQGRPSTASVLYWHVRHRQAAGSAAGLFVSFPAGRYVVMRFDGSPGLVRGVMRD